MTTEVIIERIYDTIIVDDSSDTILIETPGIVTVITEAEQGPPGPSGITSIGNASDVDTSNKTNGSLLVYSTQTEKWVATTQLENQTFESGHY